MKNNFDLDFNVLCRLCLDKKHELRPIFNDDINYSYRIESCVGLEVSLQSSIITINHYYNFTIIGASM